MIRRPAFLIVALALVGSAHGQSFNIDFETSQGGWGFGTPAQTYGAASGQAGAWQTITGFAANVPVPLQGLTGAPTAVTITSASSLSVFGANQNSPAAGDDLFLMGDVLNLGVTGAAHSFTFNNLANGLYEMFVYAMAPDNAAYLTRVNVNGPAIDGAPGAQLCGGGYPGEFIDPITHVGFSDIAITNGQLIINTQNAIGFGSLAGIQIIQVPAPGGVLLIGFGGLFGIGRRRKL